MNSVKIDREKLLGIVQENRDKHCAAFTESVEDYKRAVLKIATNNLKLAKTADLEQIAKFQTLPPKPTSHEREYDRAIRMLELSVETVIEIDQNIFNQLVLDEWQWKNAFLTNSTLYKSL